VGQAAFDALAARVDRIEEQGASLVQSLDDRIADVETRVQGHEDAIADSASFADLKAVAADVAAFEAKEAELVDQVVATHQVATTAAARAATSEESLVQRIETSERSLLEKMGSFVTESTVIERYDRAKADGATAGREAAASVAKDLLADKISGVSDFALGTALTSLVGVGGPLGIGISLAGWLVSRRLKRRIGGWFDADGTEVPSSPPFRRQTVPHGGRPAGRGDVA